MNKSLLPSARYMLAIGTVYLAVAAISAACFVIVAAASPKGEIVHTIIGIVAGISISLVAEKALRLLASRATPLIDALRSEHGETQRPDTRVG